MGCGFRARQYRAVRPDFHVQMREDEKFFFERSDDAANQPLVQVDRRAGRRLFLRPSMLSQKLGQKQPQTGKMQEPL